MKQNPKIIYKYRDWKNPFHRKILIDNELYLASPKDFNDPFDCRINHNFLALTPKEEEEYINALAIRHFPEAEKLGVNYSLIIKDFEARFRNKPEFQRFADSILFENQDKHYAIFSASLRWNSILMWAHYASNHTGFCIGFWHQKLFDSRLFGKGGEVIYKADFPIIKPRPATKDDQMMIDSFTETHSKAKEWHYEKEYRFMSTSPKELTNKERSVPIRNDFFAEIILGIAMDENDKKEIIELCKIKGIKVYQARKVDFKFKLKRERISTD